MSLLPPTAPNTPLHILACGNSQRVLSKWMSVHILGLILCFWEVSSKHRLSKWTIPSLLNENEITLWDLKTFYTAVLPRLTYAKITQSMSPNRRRNGAPKNSQAENCRSVQFLVVYFWIFLNHRCCFLFPQTSNLSWDAKKRIKIPKISQERGNWNLACNHFKKESWLATSFMCWLQSSKIPRNNPSFMYHVQNRMQKSAKAFVCRLSRWRDGSRSLFFLTEEKTPGPNFGQLNIHMNLHSASFSSSGPAEPAVSEVSTSLLTQPTSFTPTLAMPATSF